jgi:hypothetical protein
MYSFFDNTFNAFEQAEKVPNGLRFYYSIGGHVICLRFADSSLISKITPALEHLRIPSHSNPNLTICLWQSDSKPILPSTFLALPKHSYSGYMEVIHDQQNVLRIAVNPDTLTMLHNTKNLAMYWVHADTLLPQCEVGAPLHILLSWWFQQHKLIMLHGGVVGNKNDGVLLAGQGGAGKSTTALTCIAAGMSYVGDDYCLLNTKNPPIAYSLYNTAKLNLGSIYKLKTFLPYLQEINSLSSEKELIFVKDHNSTQLISKLNIRAILALEVTGRKETLLIPTDGPNKIKLLMPLMLSTIRQLNNTSTLNTCIELAKILPCFQLKIGTDLKQIPIVISDLLEEMNYAKKTFA